MGGIDILDDIDNRIYIWISRRSTRDIKGKDKIRGEREIKNLIRKGE
jgi:hypothetical protein